MDDVWLTPSVEADTDVPLTVSEMARALEVLGTPTTRQDVGLDVDPDDYPLF